MCVCVCVCLCLCLCVCLCVCVCACGREEGAVLVFLTGWDDISKLLDEAKKSRVLRCVVVVIVATVLRYLSRAAVSVTWCDRSGGAVV